MISRHFLRGSARATLHFAITRGAEVIVLQASPFLGAILGGVGYDWGAVGRIALVLVGSIALTAHVFVLNDWADYSRDVRDPRRVAQLFGCRGIGNRQVASLAIALFVAAMALLAAAGTPALFLGAGIAALSLIYSVSSSWGKGRPIAASLLHIGGGALHFLLGYTAFHPVDIRGFAIAIFFGLVFAGGHLNQEVRDYDADLRNGIRTSAVAFGRRNAFLVSLAIFTCAYSLLVVLTAFGLLDRLLIWSTLFWPCHMAYSLQALRKGLGFEAANWMQRRYRLLFAFVGLAMLLTAPAVTEGAYRIYQHARHGRQSMLKTSNACFAEPGSQVLPYGEAGP